ncbi:MAG: class I SAM-dependent methyltransferase [Candidatus Melainabacteria bacterium]|nr:class I SAM-dependent methyltransferase [Candidatus Melainabacteria bacterium]
MLKYLSTLRLIPPSLITSTLEGSWAIQVLKSAVDLGIFESLSDGPMSAVLIAKKQGLQVEGTKLIADSLVAMNLLDRADLNGHVRSTEAIYELNMTSQTYLISESPLFMGMYLKQHDELDKMWRSLRETIRTGTPVMAVNEDAKAQEIFPSLAEAIVPLNYCIAADVVKYLKERKQGAKSAQSLKKSSAPNEDDANSLASALSNMNALNSQRALNILDLAAGSAVWSIPFAQDNRDNHIAALDFPAVLAVTRKITERFEVANQYTEVPGNWRDIKLSPGLYDVVILGHILHSEGLEMSKKLLAYCAAALKEGGTLVIAEFMPNQERTAPLYPLMFGLNMYLATAHGCVFSFDEITSLCRAAGFSDVYRHQGVEYDSPVVFATK